MFFHDCYNVWMLRANEQTKPVSKLIKSELWKKTVCSVRVMGTWKKSDAQSLPSGKAKLYNYFFTPSGQVETIIYAKIALWKIQTKQQQGEGVR